MSICVQDGLSKNDSKRALFAQFSSALFCGYRGQRSLALLTAYLDDSGTHGGTQSVLAGYISTEAQWLEFVDDWAALCNRYLDGRPFKMVKANREKDPGHVPEEGLLAMARCIVKHVDTEIWSIVPDYYSKQVEDKHGIVLDKYRLNFFGLLQAAITNPYLLDQENKLAWICDHHGGSNGPEWNALELSLHQGFLDICGVCDARHKPLLHSISFANDDDTVPLQAADFLAWQKRRSHVTGAHTPAYSLLLEARMHRIQVVWFAHKIDEWLERLRSTWTARPVL